MTLNPNKINFLSNAIKGLSGKPTVKSANDAAESAKQAGQPTPVERMAQEAQKRAGST